MDDMQQVAIVLAENVASDDPGDGGTSTTAADMLAYHPPTSPSNAHAMAAALIREAEEVAARLTAEAATAAQGRRAAAEAAIAAKREAETSIAARREAETSAALITSQRNVARVLLQSESTILRAEEEAEHQQRLGEVHLREQEMLAYVDQMRCKADAEAAELQRAAQAKAVALLDQAKAQAAQLLSSASARVQVEVSRHQELLTSQFNATRSFLRDELRALDEAAREQREEDEAEAGRAAALREAQLPAARMLKEREAELRAAAESKAEMELQKRVQAVEEGLAEKHRSELQRRTGVLAEQHSRAVADLKEAHMEDLRRLQREQTRRESVRLEAASEAAKLLPSPSHLPLPTHPPTLQAHKIARAPTKEWDEGCSGDRKLSA